MSGNKAALKAAKAAVDAGKWDEVVVQAQIVLASDAQNYFAKLFLGRALEKQGKFDEAEKTYKSATALKPNDAQGLQGLVSLYEAQESKKIDEYREASVKLAQIFAEADDLHRCQTVIDKILAFSKQHGTKKQYKAALEVQLPSSPIYGYLEGRLPHPSHTYTRLIELTEAEEKERINKEIGERRTRLGARIGQVTAEVKREVYGDSPLESLYQELINWSSDDDIRRQYEEKLLQRAYDTLIVLPQEKKGARRDQVLDLARGMVIVKHPFRLAWELVIEWKDVEDIQNYDVGVLREFRDFFPDVGLSKVVKGYLTSELSPFPPEPKPEPKPEADGESKDATDSPLSTEDRLLLMTDGFDDASGSMLAHRLMSEYYLFLEEHELAVETARNGLKVVITETSKSGLRLQHSIDALNTILATALIHYQSPRNHPEARTLFNAILERKPLFIPALIGIGLIYEEDEEYQQAVDFLGKALERDPTNIRIGAEAAWCKALSGDYETGLRELEHYLPGMKLDEKKARELRAQTLYRIGTCLWELDPSKAARKDRSRGYAQFLASIKANVNFAPAYTSLGIYYADYARDKKRARQCFQKAFELSASEVEAAERLARSFADSREWDIVEIIATRVVESGKTRPPPGSKKKGISWPYSALGVVQMNRQDYQRSIISFLAALRLSPDDYHSYVGLGESYHNSGRYNSALRTFQFAENLSDSVTAQKPGDSWFTKYMIANVNRELGEFDAAIEGYQEVLELRPDEFGVAIALIQALEERAWRCVETGFFGLAAEDAKQSILSSATIVRTRPQAFNVWKAIGDSCSIYTWVEDKVTTLPLGEVADLLLSNIEIEEYDMFSEADGIGADILRELKDVSEESISLAHCLQAATLAQKRAILSSAQDVHAQAVAWYNLGWTEHRSHMCLEAPSHDDPVKRPKKYLQAAMRCFKRAIELEAGNSEFWNALGIATTLLNPKVAQHSFVRSLHLNERSARTWTNLGTLYLLQNDPELAHNAFARAQSTDPEYAHAWVGEGLIALLYGDKREAYSHFTHAFEISDSASLLVKRQYGYSSFDILASSQAAASEIGNFIQPLFALRQLQEQAPKDIPYRYLASLFLERIGDHEAAAETLTALCAAAEAEYEETESPASLARYSQAKADLARNQLAVKDYAGAAENAQTALDLSEDAGASGLSQEARKMLRLSAHLTAGLASYYQGSMDDAIQMFRTALEESDGSADVVCLLAQVLWAKGGEDEKNVAREQLFESIEKHPAHVASVILLGVVAALDGDGTTMDAVKEDLASLRTNATVDAVQQGRLNKILAAINTASGLSDEETLGEVTSSIMLAPFNPQGWGLLAEMTDEPYPAEMAVKAALRSVPPYGTLDAEDLAHAFAGTGTAADGQRAIMLAPWTAAGWESLAAAVA